jgi:hypothetical protein
MWTLGTKPVLPIKDGQEIFILSVVSGQVEILRFSEIIFQGNFRDFLVFES